jgi:arylsulfatase A-like enzyme
MKTLTDLVKELFVMFLLALTFAAIGALWMTPSAQTSSRPNIILVVWDDVGALDTQTIPTPNLDLLAGTGAEYVNAVAHPWCSPSREAISHSRMTAKHRGDLCSTGDLLANTGRVRTLASELQAEGYRTHLVGKYHQGQNPSDGLPWYFSPHALGFDHWYAAVGSSTVGCNLTSRLEDGEPVFFNTSPVEFETSEALRAVWQANLEGYPAFVQIGYTDAHKPWVIPPPSAMPLDYVAPTDPTDRERFEAEVIALDHQLGRIMMDVGWETKIILVGDNGTPQEVAPDASKAKKTVYQRGVRVPFVFSGGPGVVAGDRSDLVSLYDIAPTILDGLGRAIPDEWQGSSFLGTMDYSSSLPRDWVYVQHGGTSNTDRAVIGERFKLSVIDGTQHLYDLWFDPLEEDPMLAIGPEAEYLQGFINQ